jgi:AcrR family transcriptional regulator
MARRTEQKEQTRQRLLASAREVFESQGFAGANIRLIAQKAKVAPGTVFVHFQDKRDLLHAALFEDLSSVLSSALKQPSADSLEGWLARLTDQMLGYYESRPVLSRILLQESLLADPPWAERFALQVAEVHATVVREAERERECGKLRPDANLPLFAAAYLSFYMFALIAWAQGIHPDPRQLVKHLTAQHLLAIQIPSTTSHERGE